MYYNYSNINLYKRKDLEKFFIEICSDKKKKISKYRHWNSKVQSIIGEILLKNGLKMYLNVNYDDLDFYLNDYGKPYIKDKNIYFNLSHSHDYVISIINNKPIGIDIEKIRTVPLKNINFFATKKEKEYILEDRKEYMKRLWCIYTLKEAYFKMKGTNLNNIFDVEFIIKNNTVICSDKNVDAHILNCIDGYMVTYCKEK